MEPLAIEVGRYKGIPEEQRLCDLGVVKQPAPSRMDFILYSIALCTVYLRSCWFEKIPLKIPDLFWLSEAGMLSRLFNMEIFVLA